MSRVAAGVNAVNMNKSILIKSIANTKFSELSEEKLEAIYHLIKEPEDTSKCCPKCYYTKLAYFSSLNYKQCTKCGFRIPWERGEKQKPLVKHQR